ncbi:MAG TPA: PEP-CTERM-box response regulator transcription factor, partial [Allosphingosinicella sp.]|nr:PEP-CTERM-box response regulator transcription factor [Allosphingosinicella sp.]
MHVKPKLLIVEDDEGLQRQLRWAYDDYEVLVASDRDSALNLVRANEPAVVTLDLGLPPDPDGVSEGFAALEKILTLKPETKVIVASGHGARESALRAIASGAYDFYQKPVDIDQLGLIVRRAFQLHGIETENRRLESQVGEGRTVLGTMITAAPEMLKVARTIERVANADVSVMLLGASGTGKELLARGLHEQSRRRGGGFVAINCAAIPENLLEAELFGYEKGAFTGAIKTTEGKIELAHGGTLFLDEVGDIPLPLQVKLLRFLQERVVERIGGRRPIPVDTRIVCATHQNLDAMIAAGTFREDLYYRLAEIVVRIPSLAERSGDPGLLAKHFLGRFAREMNPQVKGFAGGALAAIEKWHWPGNVRELENRMKRAVIMAEGKYISVEDLDLSAGGEDGLPVNLKAAREAADRAVIRSALAQTDGNISSAAKLLGI